ncbi:hypothetical protein MBLNU459_g0533t1 [Dothideomycetes sp. NU459]
MAAVAPSTFGLQPPPADDTMEISSNFGGDMDGDIDIDLDSAGEQMQYDEDDQMIDDAKPENMLYQDHVDEDVMVDDDAAAHPEDRVMQDSPPHPEHDEELLDFSDNEDVPLDSVDNAAVQDASSESQSQSQPQPPELLEQVQSDAAAELLAEGVEPVDFTAQTAQSEQHQPQPELHEPDQTEVPTPRGDERTSQEHGEDSHVQPDVAALDGNNPQTEEVAQDPLDGPTSQSLPQQHTSQHADQSQESAYSAAEQLTVQPNESHESREDVGHEAHAESTVADPGDQVHASQPAELHVNTEVLVSEETEHVSPQETRPDSPTVTGLHPTIVEYDGNEIYLFPSREPASFEQYLLENENLVMSSLGDMLQACRGVLGESISEDEELVLGVEELDLYVSEDSTPAFSTSFSELLDVYLKLHHHDGNDHPPAFRVTLTTKTRFTNRLTTITQAIAEGKGFSQLAFLQAYNEYQGVTDLPDPDEDVDDEDYLEVNESASHVPAQSEEKETGQVHHDGNANGVPDQEQASDGLAMSGEPGVDEQDDDHEQDDSTDVDHSQVGEYVEGGTEEPTEDAEPARNDDQSAASQEDIQNLEAEGDSFDESVGVDGQEPQQEPSSEQRIVVSEAAPYVEGEDDLLDYLQDNVDLTTTASYTEARLPTQSGISLVNQTVHAEDFASQAFTEAVEETSAALEPQQHGEENLFDGEADDIYQAAESNYVAPQETSQPEDGEAQEDIRDGHKTPSVSADQDDENQEDVEYDASFDDFEGGNTPLSDTVAENTEDNKVEDPTTSTGDGDELDEIDFDDDENDYIDESLPTDVATEEAPAKLSPSGKRSFSERAVEGEIDEDDQALKKVRSS